jgi:hypothetical protein
MARIPVVRSGKNFVQSSKPFNGDCNVARLFVPGYDGGGIAITTPVRRSRNSDARRRLARMFEPRRIVS